jgi:hypothetical protein
MHTTLSSEHERFVHLLLIGTSEAQAYYQVFGTKEGESENDAHLIHRARLLAKKPIIARRLADLRTPVIREAQQTYAFSLDMAMQKCEDAYLLAERTQEAGHMLKAVELQAKLTKLLDGDKAPRATVLDHASTDELVRLLSELKARRDVDVVIEAEVLEVNAAAGGGLVDCSELI